MFTMGRLKSHLEVQTNNTRLDIVIELPTRIFIIELKFDLPAADGLDQIIHKEYMQKYIITGLPIIGVGMSVSLQQDPKRTIFDVVWQQLQ
jgi:hypothetical protein